MNDRELEQRLRAWYADQVGTTEVAPDELRATLKAIRPTPSQASDWARRRRNLTLLGIAAVLTVGGALAAGAGLLRLDDVKPEPSDALLRSPAPTDAPLTTPAPTGTRTETPAPSSTPNVRLGGLIAFTKTTGQFDPQALWIIGSDGRGAHQLLADAGGSQSFESWSPDGARLLYWDYQGGPSPKLYLTDLGGGKPQLVETGCVVPPPTDASWCADGQVAFSPDGLRIAVVRHTTIVEDGVGKDDWSSVVTMDLATGRTAELNATRRSASRPTWSPDGRQIVFTRSASGFREKLGQWGPADASSVWLIDADGRNPRQVTPTGLSAYGAAWAPDGARIVFESRNDEQRDVYTVNPDGTSVRRLTTDGLSQSPSWTEDGRILFTRRPSGNEDDAAGWWTMDADGSNAAQIMAADAIGVPPEGLPFTRPVWQPLHGQALVPPPYAPREAAVVGPPAPTPLPTPPPQLAAGFSWTGVPKIADDEGGDVSATRLADGRVLITVGCSTEAQLYDPATGEFIPTGSAKVKRSGNTTTLLRDGRVLVAGGRDCDGGSASASTSAELYDPGTGTFARTGSMRTPRQSHTATLLADGRVLITGGATGATGAVGSIVLAAYRTAETGGTVLETAEIFDPATGRFSRTGSMSDPRLNHSATLLADGRVLVAGGGGASGETRSADLYDPATGRFSRTGSMHEMHWDHASTLLDDGRVLITGGRAEDPSLRSAELYDPRSGTFSRTGDMGVGRAGHDATRLHDGRVLLTGGVLIREGGDVRLLSSAEMFDPDSGTFTSMGSTGYPPAAATLLDDGRVVIVGGNQYEGDSRFAVPSAVLYQP